MRKRRKSREGGGVRGKSGEHEQSAQFVEQLLGCRGAVYARRRYTAEWVHD
jgi:hypothetical protein